MMRILLLGKHGQLGWELQRSLAPLGQVQSVDYPEIDLAKPQSLRSFLRAAAPHLIVNATGYTAVDRAESERELAYAINATAVGVMAEQARALNAALIHYSTDYVFDGKKGEPYLETDTPNPLNVYGASKLAGEQAVQAVDGVYLILRTAWVYSLRRDSFVTKVLGWARRHGTLRIVDDQVSNPTWARMLAETTALLVARAGTQLVPWLDERKGLYHLAGAGYASRLDWAKEILKLDPNPGEQVAKEILPASTQEFPAPATRPLFSALNCVGFEQAFDLGLPSWKKTLQFAI